MEFCQLFSEDRLYSIFKCWNFVSCFAKKDSYCFYLWEKVSRKYDAVRKKFRDKSNKKI